MWGICWRVLYYGAPLKWLDGIYSNTPPFGSYWLEISRPLVQITDEREWFVDPSDNGLVSISGMIYCFIKWFYPSNRHHVFFFARLRLRLINCFNLLSIRFVTSFAFVSIFLAQHFSWSVKMPISFSPRDSDMLSIFFFKQIGCFFVVKVSYRLFFIEFHCRWLFTFIDRCMCWWTVEICRVMCWVWKNERVNDTTGSAIGWLDGLCVQAVHAFTSY